MSIDHGTDIGKGPHTRQSLNSNLPSDYWVSRFERLSRAFSIVAVIIAGVVLLGGYVLGISGLRNLVPGLPKMMPNTALGLLLSAVSLLIYTTNSKTQKWYNRDWIPRLPAIVVFLLGAATITEYFLGINIGIDEILFRDIAPGATYPGRPSPQTSLGFVLLGISLMLLGGRQLWMLRLSHLLGVIVGFMAILAVVGYVYSALPFYGITTYTGMAIHTALSFLVIACGIIFSKSDRGLAAVFTSHSEGGHLARRLLPAIIIIPIALGILSRLGETAGLFSTETGMAADVTLHIVLLGAELWLFALFLDRSNKARDEAIQVMNRRSVQLEMTNQDLQALSYSVPSNLIPHLSHLAGLSDALWEGCGGRLDEKEKKQIKSIRESLKTVGYLVDDLLKLAQVTSAEMHRETVDLSDAAETLLAELKRSNPDQQVEYVIAPGLGGAGDTRLIRVAIENLLENAWKYSAKVSSPKIEVGAIENERERTFFVRDNGVGFDMSHADKLFHPFQRFHQADEFPGTGIGLAIVQRIIHRHGGRIWATSKVGEGATFYFTLGNVSIPG